MVNYGFIFAIILFIEGDYGKRMLVEASTWIIKIGSYFIQFKTFSYIWVVGTILCLKKLPQYPSDGLLLLERERQLAFAYDRVRKQHKKTWVWPITIGSFEVKKKDIAMFYPEWDEYPLEGY